MNNEGITRIVRGGPDGSIVNCEPAPPTPEFPFLDDDLPAPVEPPVDPLLDNNMATGGLDFIGFDNNMATDFPAPALDAPAAWEPGYMGGQEGTQLLSWAVEMGVQYIPEQSTFQPDPGSMQVVGWMVIGGVYLLAMGAAAEAVLGACMGMISGAAQVVNVPHARKVLWQHGGQIQAAPSLMCSMLLGGLRGMVTAPISFVCGVAHQLYGLACVVLRPAAVFLGGYVALRWWDRRNQRPGWLVRNLFEYSAGMRLAALRRVEARAANSPTFTSHFRREGGVKAVLQALEVALVVADQEAHHEQQAQFNSTVITQAQLAAAAVAQLATNSSSAEEVVRLGGMPLLVRAMARGHAVATAVAVPESPGYAELHGSLLVHSAAALARLTSQLESAREALLAREPSLPKLLVAVLGAAAERRVSGAPQVACDKLSGYAVSLCQVIALTPAGKSELSAAGAVDALSAALVMSAPWSMAQAAAATALHALVRGDPDNQRRLAAVAPAGLSAAIHRSLAATSTWGWVRLFHRKQRACHRGELLALSNIIVVSAQKPPPAAAAGEEPVVTPSPAAFPDATSCSS